MSPKPSNDEIAPVYQPKEASNPEVQYALPPKEVSEAYNGDVEASESRLVQGQAQANGASAGQGVSGAQASAASYADYYEYYYDSPSANGVSTTEDALNTAAEAGASGLGGNELGLGQDMNNNKLAQRRKLAAMRRRLKQKLAAQQQLKQQQQQQLGQQQETEYGATGFGALDEDYYDANALVSNNANLMANGNVANGAAVGQQQLQHNVAGARRGVGAARALMRQQLPANARVGANAAASVGSGFGGSGLGGTGVGVSGYGGQAGGGGFGLGATGNVGAGAGFGPGPSYGLSPAGGYGGLNARGGHGHHGGYGGGHGGGGHGGGYGKVVVLKKKKKDDDEDGLFGYLEEIFGDLSIDFETFALLLGAAGALASFVLFQVIQSNGRRRSMGSGGPAVGWAEMLSDVMFHGKRKELGREHVYWQSSIKRKLTSQRIGVIS